MIKQINLLLTLCLSILIFSSCHSSADKTEKYIAIYKKDTAYLTLSIYNDTYHGKMIVKGMGDDKELGKVHGKIIGDTLVGDFLYTPYRSKYEKRKAFVLKREANTLIQGNGLEHVYMGIPYFSPASISFDNPKFVFKLDTRF